MKRGRPKGYSPYVNIPYEDLADFVGKKTLVKVCGKWLKDLINETNSEVEDWAAIMSLPPEETRVTNNKEEPKIEFELTTFNED
jgi:hypothetical protein